MIVSLKLLISTGPSAGFSDLPGLTEFESKVYGKGQADMLFIIEKGNTQNIRKKLLTSRPGDLKVCKMSQEQNLILCM